MRLEGKQLGNYQVTRLLDEGGMGQVYLAKEKNLRREVAIKVMREDKATDPVLQDRFQREMDAIAMLRHSHIVPIYTVDKQLVDGVVIQYMVMPYEQEGSLAQWIQRHQQQNTLPSPLDVVFLIQQATEALQYAHNKDILHRDIKPSNFLIDSFDNPERPILLLTDFGLVKNLQDGKLTSMGIGTPQYMAPELASQQPTKASDQYALAIMTYELLTGQVPFRGGLAEIAIQHHLEKPQLPSQLNPTISKETDAVLLRALAKKPGERYPSIQAYYTALQQSVAKQAPKRRQAPQPVPKEPVKVNRARSGSTPAFPPLLRPVGESTATLALSRKEAMTGSLKLLTVIDGMDKKRIRLNVPGGVAPGESLRFSLPDELADGHVLHAENPTTSVLRTPSRSLTVNLLVEAEQAKSGKGRVIAVLVVLVLIALALFAAWTMGIIPHV